MSRPTTLPHAAPAAYSAAPPPARRRASPLLAGAVGALGVAAAILVGRDGSPEWRVARVLVTLALAAVAATVIVRGTRWRWG